MSRFGLITQISQITEHLDLSGAEAVTADRLRQRNITCVINATYEVPINYLPGIDYMRVPIEDKPYARICDYFDIVADKIKSVEEKGGRTLVHCMAGVSRSASLCIIYLVKHQGKTLRQAYYHVKAARLIIRPNIGFWDQMVRYEGKLLGPLAEKSKPSEYILPDPFTSSELELSRYGTTRRKPQKSSSSISQRILFPPSVDRNAMSSHRRTLSSAIGSTLINPKFGIFGSPKFSRKNMFDDLWHSGFSTF